MSATSSPCWSIQLADEQSRRKQCQLNEPVVSLAVVGAVRMDSERSGAGHAPMRAGRHSQRKHGQRKKGHPIGDSVCVLTHGR